MGWYDAIDFQHCEDSPATEPDAMSRMGPGLTDTYDRARREDASVRDTPLAPACMGLEGEYDPCGLAKRVAQALDQQPHLAGVAPLSLVQKGTTIVFAGQVRDRYTLDTIVATASRVDGTHAVDVSQVAFSPAQARSAAS
ncbi:hypothetical protein [Nodosilinea nodulosa]|uniref:hypothetical protein n=1 Tax=Nodosilinea nodulosa TaxID=416001 RepID=UPI0002F5D03D|nr:hypothetical protein [Nodosilinea nodulosa]